MMSHPLNKRDPKSPSMSPAINYSATDPNNQAHGSVNPSQLLRCILSLFRRTRLNRVHFSPPLFRIDPRRLGIMTK